jgi:hypothetical protein
MDKQTADIIKSLTECLVSVTEKQAVILHLLALKLPDLSEEQQSKLVESARASEEYGKIWRGALLTSK